MYLIIVQLLSHVEFWNKHDSSCILIFGWPGMGSSRTRWSAPRQSGRQCPLSSLQPRKYWPACPAWRRQAGVVLLGTFVAIYPALLALSIISLDGVFSLTTETQPMLSSSSKVFALSAIMVTLPSLPSGGRIARLRNLYDYTTELCIQFLGKLLKPMACVLIAYVCQLKI